MIEINADMEAIIKQAILSFVATVNETPNLSPKASLTVRNGVLCSTTNNPHLALRPI
jgi:hypothetical protein